jgi:AGCS family alanine or glycine:cation symporter
MSGIEQAVIGFADWVWGIPLLVLLLGGGLFFLLYSGFVPFRHIGHAVDVLRGKYDNPDDPGQINHFQALSTALAATVGMGNISGVAIAIAMGGPGAIFWMWVTAVVGMATKFFTATLAVMYRGKDKNGELQGGPMYVITEGLGRKWLPLAVFFSLAGLFGSLPIFQANQLTAILNDVLFPAQGSAHPFINRFVTGLVLTGLVGVVIFGGIRRIAAVTSRLVPLMVVLYFLSVMFILIVHYDRVPEYLAMIFTNAFTAAHYHGHPALGGALGGLIILGARRAAFSNEAGIGTAPMAHGAAKTNEPVREGLVAMLGPAIDTLVVCTLTALAILVTDVWKTGDENGISLTVRAFNEAIPFVGKYLLMLTVVIFALSTMFSYAYYGGKCSAFLAGPAGHKAYTIFYVITILVAAIASLTAVESLISGSFALMSIPTMVSALLLAPRVKQAVRTYFAEGKDKRL